MRYIRRGIALLMLLALLFTTALAEVPFLHHSDGWTLEGVPLEAVLTADVTSLMPYDEDRLAMLTPVTDVLSLRLRAGEEQGSVAILVGRTEALTLSYQGGEAQLSCIPEMSFRSQEDVVDKLLGGSTEVSAPYGLRADAETLLEDGWVLLESTLTSFEGWGKRKSVKTSITDMGLARSCTDYTIPKESVDEMKQLLLDGCPEGWLREIIESLTFSGKQTLRVYRTEDDVPLRMEYNGTCGPEGNLRTVKLVWRMRRDDTAHRDEVMLTSPAKSGGNKNTLEFERVITTNRQGAVEMKGSFTYTVTADRQTTTRKGEFDLTNAFTDAADVLTGEVTLQQKLSGLTVAPEITIAGTNDAPVVTGFVMVSSLKGKNVLDSARITLDLRRCESFPWESREESIDLDVLTEEELAALQGDVATGVAASLVRPLILLLGDSAEWFFRDLLPEQVQRINDAARQVVNE